MTRTKTAIIVVAVPVAAVAALLWAWPMMAQDDEGLSRISNLDDTGAPESWYSENSTHRHNIKMKSEYATAYKNCILQMVKEGTGTDTISFWLYMECGSEQGIPSTYGNATNRFHFMTIPADFEASWTDNSFCDMTLTHYNTHNSSSNNNYTNSYVNIFCNDDW